MTAYSARAISDPLRALAEQAPVFGTALDHDALLIVQCEPGLDPTQGEHEFLRMLITQQARQLADIELRLNAAGI